MCSDEPLNEQPDELTRYGAIYSAGLTIEGDPKSVLTVQAESENLQRFCSVVV